MSEAAIGRKGASKGPLLIYWSALSDESNNFPLDPLMVYFQQGTSLYEQEQNTDGHTV